MKKILIVVDMQKDFIDGSLGTKEAQSIVKNVETRIQTFQGDVYYTQDTHSENYLETQEGRILPVVHCVKGTDGWKLHPEILKACEDKAAVSVEKYTFGSRELPGLLSEKYPEGLESITLIGLCTDICVISNALLLKAFFPETPMEVDASCCAGVSPASHLNALEAMKMCQISITGEN